MARIAIVTELDSDTWKVGCNVQIGRANDVAWVARQLAPIRDKVNKVKARHGVAQDAERSVRGILINDDGSILDVSPLLEHVATTGELAGLTMYEMETMIWLRSAEYLLAKQDGLLWFLPPGTEDLFFDGALSDLSWREMPDDVGALLGISAEKLAWELQHGM